MSKSSLSYATRYREFIQELSRRHDAEIANNIKKRTYEESFGIREYDSERYGQEISNNFFQTNQGHAVIG
jgi:hypothetical protein